jgi:rod shape determining protein RodA
MHSYQTNTLKTGSWRIFSNFDWTLITLIALLASFGMLVLFSAANESQRVLISQASHLLLAFAVFCICANIKPEVYEALAPYLYIGGVALLLIVMGVGHVDKGARRWLNLGFIRIQPSELMKLILPIMLASFFGRIKVKPTLPQIGIALTLIAIPFALVMKQPDLGTALMIAAAGLWVVFLCGLDYRYLIAALIAGITAIPVAWHFLHQYQKKRILTFLDPQQDPLGAGYHIIQSKIAIGSGGLAGKGFLHGTQTHLQFLPEHTTDFIYAVVGEEFGLLGCCLILGLLFAIFLRCIWLTARTKNYFSRYLITAIAASFLLEGLVNIGMVTGLLPVVGVPLPFVSYGGSALLTLGAGFGIIMSLQANKTLW